MPITVWLIILALLAVNALYVAAEFAAVGVRRSRLQARAEQGHKRAKRMLHVAQETKHLDHYIATCQIGITFSSLVLGAYGQVTLTPELAPVLVTGLGLEPLTALSIAAVTVLATLTTGQVVFGELVPKSLALQFPTRTALATVVPVLWSARLLSPFIWVLNGSAMVLLRAMQLDTGGHRHVHSPEEIELLVAESRKGGLLDAEEHQRLHAALRLRRIPAKRLMVPIEEVLMLPEDAPRQQILETLDREPYTRVPVYRGTPDAVVGFLHTKDVFLQEGASISELLRPLPRIPASTGGDVVLLKLRDSRSQMALVEEEDRPVGIVTFEDVLAGLLQTEDEEVRE